MYHMGSSAVLLEAGKIAGLLCNIHVFKNLPTNQSDCTEVCISKIYSNAAKQVLKALFTQSSAFIF